MISEQYAANVIRNTMRFSILPKSLRDAIQSAIRIAHIDGQLYQVEQLSASIDEIKSPEKPVPGSQGGTGL